MGFSTRQEDIILALWEAGGIEVGDFTLRNGEKDPVYCNLRFRSRHENGVLPFGLLDPLVEELIGTASMTLSAYELVAPIPHGGTPYGERLAERENKTLLRLARSGRRITGLEQITAPLGPVLVVDDVLHDAETKLEALAVLEQYYEIAGVLVVVDRCQGGKKRLEEHGVQLAAAFELPDILLWLKAWDQLSAADQEKVAGYLATTAG